MFRVECLSLSGRVDRVILGLRRSGSTEWLSSCLPYSFRVMFGESDHGAMKKERISRFSALRTTRCVISSAIIVCAVSFAYPI